MAYENLKGGLTASQVTSLIETTVPLPLAVSSGGSGATTPVGLADAGATLGDTIATSSSIDLSSATGATLYLSGSTDVETLGSASEGVIRHLIAYDGCFQFIYNAGALATPDGKNLFVTPGDAVTVVSLGSSVWKVISVYRHTSLKNKAVVNLASGCTATNTGTVSGNLYTNGNWLIYINNTVVGFGKATPQVASGTQGLLPGGTSAGTIDWSKPFEVTARVSAKVSTKSTSGGALCFFFGHSPTSASISAEGLLFVARGTDTTSAISAVSTAHSGAASTNSTAYVGTLTLNNLITYLFKWVPGYGFFVFMDGTLVNKVTDNLPSGNGPADSNLFGWAIENVTSNTVKAEAYFNSVTVST